MKWILVASELLIIMLVVYYFTIIMDLIFNIGFTKKKIKIGGLFIPFYYWFFLKPDKTEIEKEHVKDI